MEVWIASGNKGKVTEFQILLKDIPDVKFHLQNEIPGFTPRPEDGKTFLDNARIKAKTLKAIKPGTWIIADDSGLEVEGLNNLPGVHSARYAGPKASDMENVAKLLKMMTIRPIPNRNARFVCSLVVITPAGEEWVFEGTLNGRIALKPTGIHGFGYDPIFIPEGQEKSLAELGPGFKNLDSHRSKATKQFLEKLKSAAI